MHYGKEDAPFVDVYVIEKGGRMMFVRRLRCSSSRWATLSPALRQSLVEALRNIFIPLTKT